MIENGLEINARQEATRESTLRILLVDGGDEQSHVIGGSVRMAPGFGLLSGVIIDQHFMERGRVGRLIGAVAQNPKNLGRKKIWRLHEVQRRRRRWLIFSPGFERSENPGIINSISAFNPERVRLAGNPFRVRYFILYC